MSFGLASEEQRDLIVSVATHRDERRLSPLEVSRLFSRACEHGASLGDCAELAGLSGPTMVSRFLRLQELPQMVIDLVDWGSSGTTLAFTAASEIARLPEAARELAALTALAAGLRTGEITQVVQRILRGERAAEDAVEEILRLRPKVERRHVFVSFFADQELATRAAGLSADAAAASVREVLTRTTGPIAGEARLTGRGFVIVTDDGGAAKLHALRDFEAELATALSKIISEA